MFTTSLFPLKVKSGYCMAAYKSTKVVVVVAKTAGL